MPLFILGFQLQPVGGTVGGARPHPQSWLTTNERWRWTRLDECAVAIGWRRWMPVPHWPTRHLRSVGAHFAIWNSPRQMARGCEAPAIPLLQLRVSHTRYHHFFLFLSLFLSFFLSFFLPFQFFFNFRLFFLSKDSSPLPQMLPKIPQFRYGSLLSLLSLSLSLSPPPPSPREILREPSRFPGKMLPRQPTPTGHAFIDSFLSTGINPRPYLSRQPHFLEML